MSVGLWKELLRNVKWQPGTPPSFQMSDDQWKALNEWVKVPRSFNGLCRAGLDPRNYLAFLRDHCGCPFVDGKVSYIDLIRWEMKNSDRIRRKAGLPNMPPINTTQPFERAMEEFVRAVTTCVDYCASQCSDVEHKEKISQARKAFVRRMAAISKQMDRRRMEAYHDPLFGFARDWFLKTAFEASMVARLALLQLFA